MTDPKLKAIQSIDELMGHISKLRDACEEAGLKTVAAKLQFYRDSLNYIKSLVRDIQ